MIYQSLTVVHLFDINSISIQAKKVKVYVLLNSRDTTLFSGLIGQTKINDKVMYPDFELFTEENCNAHQCRRALWFSSVNSSKSG